MPKLELYLSKIVKYGLYAILLTPLAFWPKALFPFLTPKFILFQILVEIVFFAWLALAVSNKEYRPKFNWLIAALAIFIATSFVSAVFGIDFSRSFWGIGARMTGLFAELHFFAWFLALISVSKSGFFLLTRYLNFSFFISIIAAISLFFQAGGVFNNPTFIVPYLSFHFFWGFYQFLVSRSWLKLVWGISAAFLFFSVFFTGVRGAAIGFLAGLFFLGIALVFNNGLGRRFKLTTIAVLLAGVLVTIGVWYFREANFVRNIVFLRRLTGITLKSTTVQTRFLAWQTALSGFKDKPILGVGPENFNYLFNLHYNPKFLKFGGGGFGETWFDKPHNAFLEILTETGIIGSLAFVFICIVTAGALLKLFKTNQKFLSSVLSSAFISYLVTVFFSFDSFGSWFGLFLFLAFFSACSNDTNARIHADDTNNSYIHAPFIIGAVIFVIFLMYVNCSIWRANIADADALRIFPSNSSQGVGSFQESLNHFTPYKSEYQFDLLASVAGALEKRMPMANLENVINFALDEADKAVLAHPKNASYYTDMFRVYNILGELGRDPQILAQAKVFGDKSLELSPNRQETLFYLSKNAALEGDTKLAVSWALQAVEAEPTVKLSHWYLGLAYLLNQERDKGIVEIKKAFELGYKPQNQSEKDFIKNLGL